MYGFLVLLPLTVISLVIGWLIAGSPQIADYVEYVTDLPKQAADLSAIWADKRLLAQIAAHVLAYAVLCFVVMATVRTISAPLPHDRPAALRRLQLCLEILFVSLPSAVLIWISARALVGNGNNLIHWFAIGILSIGLITTVAITANRRPLELYCCFVDYRITKTDAVAALSALLMAATIVAFALYPRESAREVGLFPVLMLATSVTLLAVAAIFSRHVSPVAVISSLISGVLLLNVIDQVVLPGREFRYRQIGLPSTGDKPTVAQVKAQRKILDLTTAFYQWLEHRRPAIEEYKKKGRAYPIILVSAQGGGIYAAYHPALSLARLTDDCPEFAHHLFAIDSVSGGSVGAAVFAELMRVFPKTEQGSPASSATVCSRSGELSKHNFLQTKVQTFFETDFLSPVIARGLLFDAPSLLAPQLRFGHDRAKTLELGFEAAWRKLGLSDAESGLAGDFLERWDPTGPAPALFMATTGVNFGIPVLISQVDWSFNPSRGASFKGKKGSKAELEVRDAGTLQTVLERLRRPDDQLQVGIANILEFRPDVQLNTSTAIVLSARFPLVTPPGTIKRNDQIALEDGGIFQKVKVLELTDGGFYDNSGSSIARELIRTLNQALDSDDRLKAFKNDVRFHLLRFTDTPAKRQALASEGAHYELVSPLAAYNAVRLSRGVVLANPSRTTISDVNLLDEWYEGTLNWLLSRSTKRSIEIRSSWYLSNTHENEVCCVVHDPAEPKLTKRIPLSEAQEKELAGKVQIQYFIPNAAAFECILEQLNKGASIEPPSAAIPCPSATAESPK